MQKKKTPWILISVCSFLLFCWAILSLDKGETYMPVFISVSKCGNYYPAVFPIKEEFMGRNRCLKSVIKKINESFKNSLDFAIRENMVSLLKRKSLNHANLIGEIMYGYCLPKKIVIKLQNGADGYFFGGGTEDYEKLFPNMSFYKIREDLSPEESKIFPFD